MDKLTKKRLSESKPVPDVGWEDVQSGLPVMTGGMEIKELPVLTKQTYNELGRLNCGYVGNLVYVNELIAEAAFDLKQAKLSYRRKRSERLFVTTGPFKAKVFAKVNMDPDVQELQNDLLIKEAKMSALKSLMWSLKGYISAIEFEVTRRREANYVESKQE